MALRRLLFAVLLLCSGLTPRAATAAGTTYRVISADAARVMWENGDGYCGEVSLQLAGLQMGFWVGQNQARNLAGGEALLDVNYDILLNQLHLWHTNWSGGTTILDAQNFLDWVKHGLTGRNPVIFALKTHDTWGTDNDYDHIMNADAVNVPALEPPLLSIATLSNQQCQVRILNAATHLTYQLQWSLALSNGVQQWSTLSTGSVGQSSFTAGASARSGFFRVAASENQYEGNNSLYYADGIDGTEHSLSFDQWVQGYTNIAQYYYLPPKATVTLVNGAKVNSHGRQYGTILTGQDGSTECVPLTLSSVTPQSEANVTQGDRSSLMSASVNMSGLMPGTHYALLRWDANYSSIGSIPWTNLLHSASATNFEWQFTATNSTAVRNVSFMSDGISLFRLVIVP
jgi:hypothetical protein